MAKTDRTFLIPFVGLKMGTHEFHFEIENSFFEEYSYALVQQGNLKVDLLLEKKERMLIANFSVKGEVDAECDRCNTPMKLPIKNRFQIIYSFGNEPSEDENLIVISPDAYEIDVKDAIYELISLAIPNRKVHPEGDCDEEMRTLMEKYTVNYNAVDEEDDEEWWDEDDDEDYDGDDDEDDDSFDPDLTKFKNFN